MPKYSVDQCDQAIELLNVEIKSINEMLEKFPGHRVLTDELQVLSARVTVWENRKTKTKRDNQASIDSRQSYSHKRKQARRLGTLTKAIARKLKTLEYLESVQDRNKEFYAREIALTRQIVWDWEQERQEIEGLLELPTSERAIAQPPTPAGYAAVLPEELRRGENLRRPARGTVATPPR